MTVFTTKTNKGLSLFVCVQKHWVKVLFEPSIMFGNISQARYITDDKQVVDALKKHPLFNSTFFVEREEVKQTVPSVEQSKIDDYRELCKDKEHIVEELSVVDVATAQNWCQRKHDTVFKARKAETIKQEAAEKFNTVFPNFN